MRRLVNAVSFVPPRLAEHPHYCIRFDTERRHRESPLTRPHQLPVGVIIWIKSLQPGQISSSLGDTKRDPLLEGKRADENSLNKLNDLMRFFANNRFPCSIPKESLELVFDILNCLTPLLANLFRLPPPFPLARAGIGIPRSGCSNGISTHSSSARRDGWVQKSPERCLCELLQLCNSGAPQRRWAIYMIIRSRANDLKLLFWSLTPLLLHTVEINGPSRCSFVQRRGMNHYADLGSRSSSATRL